MIEKEYFNRFGQIDEVENVHKFVSVRKQTRKLDARRGQLLELQRDLAREEKIRRTVHEQLSIRAKRQTRSPINKLHLSKDNHLKISESLKQLRMPHPLHTARDFRESS